MIQFILTDMETGFNFVSQRIHEINLKELQR